MILKWAKRNKLFITLFLSILIFMIGSYAIYFTFGHRAIEDAYYGRSLTLGESKDMKKTLRNIRVVIQDGGWQLPYLSSSEFTQFQRLFNKDFRLVKIVGENRVYVYERR